MIRRAVLTLAASAPAVFSARAATEGAHRSLAHPTGSALLGWAAAQAGYSRFADPFTVFHSGRVRFSNAFPVIDGEVAWPLPHLLMEPKHAKDGVRNGCLNPSALRVGRPGKGAAGATVQYEALKGLFVTASGRVAKPRLGGRLRTATRGGRAATGQLFGYQHIEPAGSPWCYRATIEADEGVLSDEEWRRLLRAFDGRTLRLGRGAGTGYGGHYACRVEHDASDLWPGVGSDTKSIPVRVWALSDVALVDRFGAPSFAPAPEAFGLPAGAVFLADESAISVRRFAPWNTYLERRDVERQVIDAGSVLSFRIDVDCDRARLRSIVGLWREAGLGRVWIAPPMLAVPRGEAPVLAPDAGAVASLAEPQQPSPLRPDHELVRCVESARAGT